MDFNSRSKRRCKSYIYLSVTKRQVFDDGIRQYDVTEKNTIRHDTQFAKSKVLSFNQNSRN